MNIASNIQANEEKLILGLKANQSTALKTIYEKYSSALFGVITRIVNDDHLAEDILQEAFMKIWNNAASYDSSKGRLFTWMLNICRNTAIDKMRSKGFKTGKKTVSDETVLYENPTKIYDDIKPDTIGIREIVNKLKPEWKQLIDLIYFKGYTHQEASEELDIPLGTVKTRLRSAIMLLREKI
ncbi:MAG: RNA polymerase sigma factor [Chitinophagales bacterium]